MACPFGLLTRINGRPAQTVSIGFASEGYDDGENLGLSRDPEFHQDPAG